MSNKLSGILKVTVLVFIQMFFFAEFVRTAEIKEKWESSPHADGSSESFIHWDDEGKIPQNCAACHSGAGFLDFLGEDGSVAGVVDKEHAVGSLVDCQACHNDSAKALKSVKFPSGVVKDNLESSVQCMVCHQGRSSTKTVNEKLAELSEDTVDEALSFINIHYRAAAATLYGGEVAGGYQYKQRTYTGRFAHVAGFDTCTSCHDAHTTKVELSQCTTCHAGNEEFQTIRMSHKDFDGDGDNSEGVKDEIESLYKALGEAIETYSANIADAPVAYKTGQYPYFFNDTNKDGEIDDEEAVYPNRYQSWTPRLIKAAYNYQFVSVDPGGYSHNAKYLLQLLYDSLQDLNVKIDNDLDSYVRP